MAEGQRPVILLIVRGPFYYLVIIASSLESRARSIFTTEMIGLYFINKLFADFILINTVVESQTRKLSTSASLFKAK